MLQRGDMQQPQIALTHSPNLSYKTANGVCHGFPMAGSGFFSPVRGTTIYIHVYGYKRRVHVRIKGTARKKPLLVWGVLIFLHRLKYPIFKQKSPEKQKLSPVAKPVRVVKIFTC